MPIILLCLCMYPIIHQNSISIMHVSDLSSLNQNSKHQLVPRLRCPKRKSQPPLSSFKSSIDHSSQSPTKELHSLISKKRERVVDWEEEILKMKKQRTATKAPCQTAPKLCIYGKKRPRTMEWAFEDLLARMTKKLKKVHQRKFQKKLSIFLVFLIKLTWILNFLMMREGGYG